MNDSAIHRKAVLRSQKLLVIHKGGIFVVRLTGRGTPIMVFTAALIWLNVKNSMGNSLAKVSETHIRLIYACAIPDKSLVQISK